MWPRIGMLMAMGLIGDAIAGTTPFAYHLAAQIPVPGIGNWENLSIDSETRRLYIAHGDRVDVLDIDRNRVLGSIVGTPGVHGFALAPTLKRGFASDAATSEVSVVDLEKGTTVARIPAGTGPDAIVFNPRHDEVYSFNGRGRSATVIDARSNKVAATLVLPGQPGSAVVDPAADRVYANIADKNLLIAIDGQSHRIVALWDLLPGQNPSGLAIDLAKHRLFVACRNQKLLMLDAQTGGVLGAVPIGRDVDATAFDPQTQLLFTANGEGTLTIAREQGANRLALVETLRTQPGAHTLALDPTSHKVYLVTADLSRPPPQANPASASAPVVIPDSFRVLVYAP